MNTRLEKYINHKAKSLARRFPQLDKDDLINDAWLISLVSEDDNKAFLDIRRHFNKVKMQTVRDSIRFVSLSDRMEESLGLTYDPEDELIMALDLVSHIKEAENPTSEWKERIAKEKIKKYIGD